MHQPIHHVVRTGAPGARIGDGDLEALAVPPALTGPVDAHRGLRGPYTAAGTLMRAIVPEAMKRCPDLVAAHDIEILTVAPELRAVVDATHETLTSLAIPEERTRFYSRMRTLRLAHGMTEFLRDFLTAAGKDPVSLVIDRIDQADQTDQELVSVLVRRLDPARITLVLGLGTDPDPESPLGLALAKYADTRDHLPLAHPALTSASSTDSARRYIESECTEVGPIGDVLWTAYESLPAAERSALHDERAALLEARDELSLSLGAVAFHREHGSDTAKAILALRKGLDYCIDMGFYEATVDFGKRGRALIDWDQDMDHWWAFTTKMTTSLAALGRPKEAEELYDEARAFTDDPSIHMQAAYATAMLYTRHHEDDRKDHRRAMAWINEAIGISKLLPDPEQRAFNTVFHQNGRALIENHMRRPEDALKLVSNGLDLLERELGADEHKLHRSVLRYNRAQVYAAIGRYDEAVADYTAVIEEDPNYSEYYFDLGGLLHKLGRDEEAIAAYETAMRLSPPFPELYYNRGDVLAAQGDLNGAVADFRYVLEIDPEYTDAHVNLAGLLADLGESEAAAAVVADGLEVAPDNPHLHCLHGRLALEAGDAPTATSALDLAVAADPALAEAWALRGMLAYTEGAIPQAVEALSRALELKPDPVVFFNRGAVYQEQAQWESAIADFTAALDLDPEDPDSLLQRATCQARLGHAQQPDHAQATETAA